MLEDSLGRPQPPAGLRERLQAFHPDLVLSWVPHWQRGWTWAICYEWRKTDQQYRLVHEGKIKPEDAWELVCHLPPDCSADQAATYAEQHLLRHSDASVREYVEKANRERAQQDRANTDAALTEVLADIDKAGPELSKLGPKLPVSYIPRDITTKATTER